MRSHDGTVATAHEIYVDGRLFVSADELELGRGAAAQTERPWFAWAIRPRGTGWEWARVLLPDWMIDGYMVGQRHTPDTRAIVIARIENDMRSDAVSTGRRWGQ